MASDAPESPPDRAGRLRRVGEMLIGLSGYVGVPIIREAMIAAGQVFAEVRAEG